MCANNMGIIYGQYGIPSCSSLWVLGPLRELVVLTYLSHSHTL